MSRELAKGNLDFDVPDFDPAKGTDARAVEKRD